MLIKVDIWQSLVRSTSPLAYVAANEQGRSNQQTYLQNHMNKPLLLVSKQMPTGHHFDPVMPVRETRWPESPAALTDERNPSLEGLRRST